MTSVELKLSVPDDILASLQNEAQRRNVSLDTVVSLLVADYFEESSDEEILASLRRSLAQALAGNVRPAHEALDELEREMGDNAD